jgi:hypothetical protein
VLEFELEGGHGRSAGQARRRMAFMLGRLAISFLS